MDAKFDSGLAKKVTRREFVSASLAGAAGLSVGGCMTERNAVAPRLPPPEEDGYKLWLRYAPPGDAASRYHRVVRAVRVDGSSATCRIIPLELRGATTAMLGGDVPLNEGGLQPGTLVVGTPTNSTLVRRVS
jgi:hypothetical protein